MEPVCKLRVNRSGISLRTFLMFFFIFFIGTASWTSEIFGNRPSRQVDVLMGVDFSKNVFNVLFSFFFIETASWKLYASFFIFRLFIGIKPTGLYPNH